MYNLSPLLKVYFPYHFFSKISIRISKNLELSRVRLQNPSQIRYATLFRNHCKEYRSKHAPPFSFIVMLHFLPAKICLGSLSLPFPSKKNDKVILSSTHRIPESSKLDFESFQMIREAWTYTQKGFSKSHHLCSRLSN